MICSQQKVDVSEPTNLPYLASFISWREVQAIWQRLCSLHPKMETVTKYRLSNVNLDPIYNNGEYMIIPTSDSDYFSINCLTDCFTEEARLEAKRFNQELSPAEYWSQHHADIREKHPGASLKVLRNVLYKSTVEVMNFKLHVAVCLYDYFQPTSVFDCCSGHGDRLIAAMSRSYIRTYEGCEPNVKSQRGAMLAAQIFNANKKKRLQIHPIPFEDFVFEEGAYYDLVFTSPPYFDVEIYSSASTQSIIRHPTEAAWYSRFLLPMFLRCWERVRQNGHMAISLNNVRDGNRFRFSSTERLIADLTTLCAGAEWCGTVSVCNFDANTKKRMEPIFIWHKKHDETLEPFRVSCKEKKDVELQCAW
jgi:hypothetical protein